MTNQAVAAMAAASVLVAIGSVAWTVSHEASDDARLRAVEAAAQAAEAQAAALSEQVVRLRDAVGSDTSAPAPNQDAAATPARHLGAGATAAHSTRIADLEKAVAALAAKTTAGPASAPEDIARRGRQALEKLQGITDQQKRRTIRGLVDELVGVGDAVVPDVLAVLNSGAERVFYEGHGFGMAAGILTSWSSQRMELYDVLRQIETPAADAAFLEAVGKAHRLTDYQDLLVLYQGATDPAVLQGITALVPDMLRKMIEVGGIAKTATEARFLPQYLAGFISSHEMKDTAGLVEELLLPASPGSTTSEHQQFFRVLATWRPEGAADVALAMQERDPEKRAATWVSAWAGGAPLARQAVYYEALLSRGNFDAPTRAGLFANMPERPLDLIKERTERVADATVFVSYLEGKLSQETDAEAHRQIERKLVELRKAIEQVQKRQ